MKIENPYKVGDTVDIFYDWENESELMGTARLRTMHKSGRSFILTETMPETQQIVYNYDEWIVDWIMVDYNMIMSKPFRFNRPVKLRYIDAIGITNSN